MDGIVENLRNAVGIGALIVMAAFSLHARSDARAPTGGGGSAVLSGHPPSATADVERFIQIHRSMASNADWRIGYGLSAQACCSSPQFAH